MRKAAAEQRPDGARGPVDYDNVRHLEALAVRHVSSGWKGSLKVMEKAAGELRPVRYSDIFDYFISKMKLNEIRNAGQRGILCGQSRQIFRG